MLAQTLYTLAFAALSLLQLVSAGPIAPRFDFSPKPGIAYSPYTGTPGNSRCKTAQEITSDFAQIRANGQYGYVRLYNVDCDQVKIVLPLAQACGMKVMLGIWDVQTMDNSVNTLCDIVAGRWDVVHSVTVGNEFILSGQCTADQMIAYTNDARAKLRAKGCPSPVAAVNVFYEVIQNPNLCSGQDFIAVNAHAFFDGSVASGGAGAFLTNMRQQVKDKCGGKYTLITETGWPWQGQPNNLAVPSKEDQKKAIDSIRSDYGNDCVYFTAFDDPWKAPGSHGAEPFWGMLNVQ